MEKIKSVLSGHKKSEDATHDAPTSSTAGSAHHDGQTPIYDQMKHNSSAQPITAGNTAGTTSAGQIGTSPGLAHAQQDGSTGLTGSHGTVTGDSTRPDANVRGAGHVHEGISSASIKSGVIGFGLGERQEHAALSSHSQNPEANLNRNQIVGGGDTGRGPTTADTSEQPSTLKQALPLSGQTTSDQPQGYGSNTGATGTAQSSTSQQPYENTLRQESYTNDTDRSFPLAGGVASKHDPTTRHTTEHSTLTNHPTQHTSSSHPPVTSAREPGTKEKEVGVRDGHGREGLAEAAAAATAIGVAAPLSQSHQRDVQNQGHETREATHGGQPTISSTTNPSTGTTSQGYHPDALAAATAAVSKSSTVPPPAQTQGVGSQDSSFANTSGAAGTSTSARPQGGAGILAGERPTGQRSASHRHIPGEFPSPTPDESKTFLYYRDEVVPEPGVEGPGTHVPRGIHAGEHDSHHQSTDSNRNAPIVGGAVGGLASSQDHHAGAVGSTTSTAGPHQSDLLNKADPRVDSDLDGSRTAPGQASTAGPSGEHELRHTGSLDHPQPKSSDLSDDHHYGRDAAIAGGVGAGVAGLGYAATRDRDTPETGGSNLTQDPSPYSSKQLDPRALSSKGTLEEQRYNSQTSTHQPQTANVAGLPPSTHGHKDDTVTTDKSTAGPHKNSLLNKLDPRVKTGDSSKTTDTTSSPTTAKQSEQDSRHGRDAALVGGGIATTAGAHHALQRNDTPGAGTAVLPEEQTSRTANDPLSSSTAHQQAAGNSAPLAPSAGSATRDAHTTAPLSSGTTAAPHDSSTSAPLSTSKTNEAANSGKKPYDTYHGPKTTSGAPFYGAVGAPAPVEDNKSLSQQPTTVSNSGLPASHDQDKEHHYGRNAGLAGAGVATAGGLAYASQRDNKTDTVPASSAVGPQSSNTATGSTTTGPHQSDTLNRIDPNVNEKAGQHHYGRNAAAAGGAGAAGYGVHEVANAYGDHRSTQPSAAVSEQRYDPTGTGARALNPVPAGGQYDYNDDHTKRNVALGSGAALGAGALGGAAYAGSRHGDTQQPAMSSGQPLSSSAQPTHGIGHPARDPNATYPTQGTVAPQNTQASGQQGYTKDAREQDHSKRDAALVGAGAAAAGGAAYAHSQNQDADRERARLEKEQQERLKKEQHAHEKEQHKLDKEHAKQEKEAHKLEKEQHKHDKAVAAHDKAEHKHHKEEDKEAHRLEKEREKEARRLSKEHEKEFDSPADKEKKHGILGFLHRDKSKKEKNSADNSPRQSGEVRRSTDNSRYSRDSDDNNPDSPRWKGKNRLHKDPPKGHPAREALEHHEMGEMQGGPREHYGTDGLIGRPDAGQQSGTNTYGSQTIGQNPSARINEPHTGLPMNVNKYGDGGGGTDANPAIHGAGTGATATDWSQIKKADTPY